MFTIQQRDVPEQLVLTEQRHVKAAQLPEWIRTAGGRLTTAAASHGGINGPAFVVYHGQPRQGKPRGSVRPDPPRKW